MSSQNRIQIHHPLLFTFNPSSFILCIYSITQPLYVILQSTGGVLEKEFDIDLVICLFSECRSNSGEKCQFPFNHSKCHTQQNLYLYIQVMCLNYFLNISVGKEHNTCLPFNTTVNWCSYQYEHEIQSWGLCVESCPTAEGITLVNKSVLG